MQKIINVLVVVLVAVVIYYGVIVDYQRGTALAELATSDVELQGHKKVIDEEYRRLSLKFDGRGKHIQRMQRDLGNLTSRLGVVIDSLGNRIAETNFLLQQAEERLRDDIRDLEGELTAVTDDLSTYKRRTNRAILEIQENLTQIEGDIKALDEKVNPKEK